MVEAIAQNTRTQRLHLDRHPLGICDAADWRLNRHASGTTEIEEVGGAQDHSGGCRRVARFARKSPSCRHLGHKMKYLPSPLT